MSRFWATVCKTVRPMLSVSCLSVPSVLSVTLVYCVQTVGRIKMKLGMQVGLGPGHVVLDGNPAPLSERGRIPQFSARVYCGQTALRIKMPIGIEVGLGPGHILLDGDPAPPPPKISGTAPNFRPMSVVAKWLDGSRWHLAWR